MRGRRTTGASPKARPEGGSTPQALSSSPPIWTPPVKCAGEGGRLPCSFQRRLLPPAAPSRGHRGGGGVHAPAPPGWESLPGPSVVPRYAVGPTGGAEGMGGGELRCDEPVGGRAKRDGETALVSSASVSSCLTAPGQDGKRAGEANPADNGLCGPRRGSACSQRSVQPIVPSVDLARAGSR